MTQAPSDPAPAELPPGPTPPRAGDTLSLVALVGTIATGGLFITVGAMSQVANVGFGLWWAEVFVFFGAPYVVLRLFGYDALRTGGLGKPWLKGALIGFFAGVFNFFALVVPLQVLSQKLAPKALLETFDISGIFKQQTPIELVLVISAVCLAAPFCEEFCFRGMMQRGAEKALGPVRALIVTSIVFSAFHLDPIGFLARVELGLLFGWLMIRSGSIWPGVFAHLANNSVSVAIYFASRGASEDEDMVWWAPLAMIAVGLPLLYGVLRAAGTLSAPVRAEDTLKPVQGVGAVIGGGLAVALAAIAVLLVVDARGVQLNFVDAIVQLKEPKPEEGADAKLQWEELRSLRKEVRRGDASIEEYQVARRAAKADRESQK